MSFKTVSVTSSTGYALELEEIKDHLYIGKGETDKDDYLKAIRDVAEDYVKDITGRELLQETNKAYFDNWPTGKKYDHFDLPFSPLISVPSSGVVYTDSDGNSTTFSSTAWSVDIASEPGRLVLGYNDDWPSVTLDNNNPISIEFVAGYSTARKVPSSIKQAMLLIIGHLYENRETVIIGQGLTPVNVPFAVNTLLANKRVKL